MSRIAHTFARVRIRERGCNPLPPPGGQMRDVRLRVREYFKRGVKARFCTVFCAAEESGSESIRLTDKGVIKFLMALRYSVF